MVSGNDFLSPPPPKNETSIIFLKKLFPELNEIAHVNTQPVSALSEQKQISFARLSVLTSRLRLFPHGLLKWSSAP